MAEKTGNKKGPKQPTIIRIVNILIGRTNRREVLTFLLFVLLSAFFWIVQTAREDNVAEYQVDFIIEDQPQDMVFTTHVPSQLRVAIEDNNMNLLRYAYDNRLRRLAVNFDRYADATGNFRISAAELQSLIRTELNGSTRITSISPTLIDARCAQTEGRKFPVRINGRFEPEPNYRIRPSVLQPDSVIINAPNAVLDTLTCVFTEKAERYGLRDTLQLSLSLDLPLGVKATPSVVSATVPVSQYVERVFEGKRIRVLNEPRGRQLTIFPYAASIKCLVDCHYYWTLQEADFDVTVDYDSITSDTLRYLPIRVVYKGADQEVTNVSISPARVEFLIENLSLPLSRAAQSGSQP